MNLKDAFFACGSRKTATAKVWLAPGSGRVKINRRPGPDYFGQTGLLEVVQAPFRVTGTKDRFDLVSSVRGGGISAQAGAISLGVARALIIFDPELRKTLKSAELLKRDPREKERMKYGLAKRRKRFQWTKR
jgi:small subunit ribosomal protein S9